MNFTTTNKAVSVTLALVVALGVNGFAFQANADNHTCENLTINHGSGVVTGHVGEEFSYELDITGTEPEDVDVDGLPEGLEFDESELLIEGTPEEGGDFSVEIYAENDCDEDTVGITFDIIGSSSAGAAGDSDPNVSLKSELIINENGSYVYLSEIPYTGVGDVLRITLTSLAFALWAGALAFMMSKPELRSRVGAGFSSLFAFEKGAANNSVIDKSVMEGFAVEGTTPYISDEDEVDATELQTLRTQANASKVLFSEEALTQVVAESEVRGELPEEVLDRAIEEAKARFPREDGYLKVDAVRLKQILA